MAITRVPFVICVRCDHQFEITDKELKEQKAICPVCKATNYGKN